MYFFFFSIPLRAYSSSRLSIYMSNYAVGWLTWPTACSGAVSHRSVGATGDESGLEAAAVHLSVFFFTLPDFDGDSVRR